MRLESRRTIRQSRTTEQFLGKQCPCHARPAQGSLKFSILPTINTAALFDIKKYRYPLKLASYENIATLYTSKCGTTGNVKNKKKWRTKTELLENRSIQWLNISNEDSYQRSQILKFASLRIAPTQMM